MRQDGLIRVLVCDNTRVHTQLLADELKRDGDLQVTTSASGAEALITRPTFSDVDVLVISSTLDEQPVRGFEVLRSLRATNPEIRAVMLLDSSKSGMILDAFRAGARGVFCTRESVESLSKCVRRVFQGQIWANTRQMETLVHALASSHNIRAVDAHGLNLLSKREMEVVRCVAQGMSNREIAERLHVSHHTVKNSLFRIFDKLGVSNRVELLFMTLSQERFAQSALDYFLDERGYMSLREEATLIACQKAAEQGVLMTQVALAQFYSARRANSTDALNAYLWCSVASEQIIQASMDVGKMLTMEQILQAEQMVADWRIKSAAVSHQSAKSAGPVHVVAKESIRRRHPRQLKRSYDEPLAQRT
jgi:two-component system nitrate/nitrite response regulator NarL